MPDFGSSHSPQHMSKRVFQPKFKKNYKNSVLKLNNENLHDYVSKNLKLDKKRITQKFQDLKEKFIRTGSQKNISEPKPMVDVAVGPIGGGARTKSNKSLTKTAMKKCKSHQQNSKLLDFTFEFENFQHLDFFFKRKDSKSSSSKKLPTSGGKTITELF